MDVSQAGTVTGGNDQACAGAGYGYHASVVVGRDDQACSMMGQEDRRQLGKVSIQKIFFLWKTHNF